MMRWLTFGVVIGLLLAGLMASGCTVTKHSTKTITFQQLLDDYVVEDATTSTYFKSYKIGDMITVEDTVEAVFFEDYELDVSGTGTAVYFKSVGTGVQPQFDIPMGLGFGGNRSVGFQPGTKVTVSMVVVGTGETNETLTEIAIFNYLYVLSTFPDDIGQEEVPTAIFLCKNHSDSLTNAGTDENVATVTLTEGTLKLSEIKVQISADGDTYYDLTGFTPVPPGESTKWETGESVIVNEATLPAGLADTNGNWPSEDFYVQIIYVPKDKVMYMDHISLEQST